MMMMLTSCCWKVCNAPQTTTKDRAVGKRRLARVGRVHYFYLIQPHCLWSPIRDGGMGIGICATIRWNLHIRMTEAASHGNRSFRPTVMCIDWWWRLCCDAVGIMRRWCVAHAQQGERTATFSCLQPHSNLTVSAHTFPRSMLMLSMGMGPISGTTVVGTLVKWVFCSVVHNSLWLRRCTAVLMYNNRIFSFRDNVLTNQR